jgi:cyclophilin family peptidyl-prolyl cis-trans isomerase
MKIIKMGNLMEKKYSTPPDINIDKNKKYFARIFTEIGNFDVAFFADKAPITVNNFIFLSKSGYYNGVFFHRVIPGFVAQGGDPTGTGYGGPGYQFVDEFHPSLKHNSPGLLSMANSGPGTNGSQFFITYASVPHLDNHHTIFGKVTAGMDIVKLIPERDPSKSKQPGVKILNIEIWEE